MRRTLGTAVLCGAALLNILSAASATVSIINQPADALTVRSAEIGHRAMVAKIISVLAIRSTDGKALEKATEKLAAMKDSDLRLLSSLCGRIAADRGTAGADLAFSLVTAMIVLA